MKRTVTSLLLFIIVFAWTGASYAADAGKADGRQDKPKIIKLKVNMKQERESQKSLDDGGHQPWREDADDVARVSLSAVNDKVGFDDCRTISESRKKALVKCKGKKTYLVTLKKLVKPNKHGIWTAVSIEVR